MTDHDKRPGGVPVKNTITLSDTHREFLADTFARNRAMFGGYTMEGEDPGAEQTGEQQPEGQEPGEAGEQEPGEQAPENEQESGEDEGDNDLTLDDAKGALSKVRRENATWRTRYAELEKKLEDATPDKIEAIKQEVRAESAAHAHSLLIENVALKHKLPEELAGVLKGDTREELDAHAKVLAKFVKDDEPEDDPELEGGLTPGDTAKGSFDPLATARANSRRR